MERTLPFSSFINFFLQVSKSPSDMEIALTIIRNNSRGFLGRDNISAARKQLDLLEVMHTYLSCLSNLCDTSMIDLKILHSSLMFGEFHLDFSTYFLHYHPFVMVIFLFHNVHQINLIWTP